MLSIEINIVDFVQGNDRHHQLIGNTQCDAKQLKMHRASLWAGIFESR